MSPDEAAEILRRHNLWRRGNEEFDMADPRELGVAIDTVLASRLEYRWWARAFQFASLIQALAIFTLALERGWL